MAVLAGAARDAAAGLGTVVLISGEAGIGKSSLVAAIDGVVPAGGRLLIGNCDDLSTPRVLGPLRDLAGSVGTALARALEGGDRGRVLEALPAELAGAGRPTVLVVDDVHWADEATLDVLRFLVPRVARLPVALVLTYRDDDLAADHPVRTVLGLAARAERARRLRPARLTADAVRRLGSAADADEIFAVTSGNPYFVTELLASGNPRVVPLTVADAVHARLARLGPADRERVGRLAVVPSAVPGWLAAALVPGGLATLAPAELCGLLVITASQVSFRHELARRAVVGRMPAAARIAANHRVLTALLARPGADVSRVMHHAIEAGDSAAIVRYGPVAAREASAAGAHREAAGHLRLVLGQHAPLEPAAEAELCERLAIESYTVDAPAAEAFDAQRRAVELRRGGDPSAYGNSLRLLSRVCWWVGQPEAACAAADEAIAVLEAAGAGEMLAMALSGRAQLHALAGQDAEAIPLARRAIDVGRQSPAIRSHALNNLGLALQRQDMAGAVATLEESLRVALEAGETEHACRAYNNLTWTYLTCLRHDDAARLLARGIDLAERSEFVTLSRVLNLALGAVRFATSDFGEVEGAATPALAGSPPVRCSALTLIGRTRLRRGEPGAVEALREAWTLAVRGRECQRIGLAAAALAEAATLLGDSGGARSELTYAAELAERCGSESVRAELTYWLRQDQNDLQHPYALLATGRWREAARRWRQAGSRYEYALALSHSPDTGDQFRALTVLDALGAVPLARLIRTGLKSRDVRRIPRGPQAVSRANHAGLTARQAEVVGLLARGMTNPEIAAELTVSPRTVDSHVAAAMTKLGAHDRRKVAAAAARLGIVPHPPDEIHRDATSPPSWKPSAAKERSGPPRRENREL